MPAEHGAALPVDFLSAYLVLVVMGSVRTGTRVLVHDVASSAGLAALAVCGILGGEVMGTA